MLAVLKASVFASSLLGAATMLWSADSDSGQPVSNAICAELRGGCPGVKAATCDNEKVCSNNGYTSCLGTEFDLQKPDGAATTYCSKTLNGETVCNDANISYDSCVR